MDPKWFVPEINRAINDRRKSFEEMLKKYKGF
jgi:hypothetical protein